MVRQVIKLSDAVQVLPRQATQFVHGAPGSFLAIGDEKAQMPAGGTAPSLLRRGGLLACATPAEGRP